MPSGRERFARLALDRAAGDLPDWPLATITAISTGGGTDGGDLVTVDYMGAALDLPHLSSYTPVVGHRVALVRWGGVWTVVGRSVGFP